MTTYRANARLVLNMTGPRDILNTKLLLATNWARIINQGSLGWAPAVIQAEFTALLNPLTVSATTASPTPGLTFGIVGASAGSVPMHTEDIYVQAGEQRTAETRTGPSAAIDVNSNAPTWGKLGNLSIRPGLQSGFTLSTPGLLPNGTFQDQPGYINTDATLNVPTTTPIPNTMNVNQLVALRPGWAKYAPFFSISWPVDPAFKYPTTAEITILETDLGLFDVVNTVCEINVSFLFDSDTSNANQGSNNQFPLYMVMGFVDADITLNDAGPLATRLAPPASSLLGIRLDAIGDSAATSASYNNTNDITINGIVRATLAFRADLQVSKNAAIPMFL